MNIVIVSLPLYIHFYLQFNAFIYQIHMRKNENEKKNLLKIDL